jgi:hypothetical protein
MRPDFVPNLRRNISISTHWLPGILFLLFPVLLTAQQLQRPLPLFHPIPDSLLTTAPLETGLRIPQYDAGYGLPSDTIPAYSRKAPLKSINFNGYYRLFLYGRTMTEPWPNLAPYERAYGVADPYREPMLSFWVNGRPNGRANFGTELFFFTPYLGTPVEGNVFSMNLGVNFYGNFRTDIGRFGIRAGGIHWYTLSPFTMGTYQVVDLYSIFDRTPWEGVTNTERYESYFSSGAVNRDTRWGNRAFQGIMVEGSSLPGNLSFALLAGKTDNNAGLAVIRSDNQGNVTFLPSLKDPLLTIQNSGTAGNVPTYQGFSGTSRLLSSLAFAGKLQKKFGSNTIAYNGLHSQTLLDSIGGAKRTFNAQTISYDLNIKKIRVFGEMGAGSFSSPALDRNWGEALMLRIQLPKEYTLIPLDLQLYQINKDFYNPNSEIQTFSNPDIQSVTVGQSQAGQPSSGGSLTQVYQLAHNRRGMNLSTGIELGPLKLNAGIGIAAELDSLSTELSYVHRINGLALSRIYNPFPENATGPTVAGPYNRVITFFRGAYEVVKTTDIDPADGSPLSRKYFNAIDVQAKFKQEIGKRPLYLFYLGSFGSIKDDFSLIPSLSDNAFLFAQYHEFDIYYSLLPSFILTGYFGLERIQGGRFTDWDAETQLPRDQTGTGIGIGFDWTLAENAGIFFRQRFMNFQDKNFSLDHYKGHESTLELKIFF